MSQCLSQARPKLLDRVRQTMRTRHYSRRTEITYVAWIKRFIFFHDKRHPSIPLPVVLNRDEVRIILSRLNGTPRLMATILYGSGLRLLECCRLRVKDADFASNQIVVREGKGDKDRVTLFPVAAKMDLARHLDFVRSQHERDLDRGGGWVELPMALARKYPNAGREWGWQWVFPATRIYVDRESGQRRRHYLRESVL